jgi:hypothetical protein
MNSRNLDDPLTTSLREEGEEGEEGSTRVHLRSNLSRSYDVLTRRFAGDPPGGYVLGKTRMRDLLMAELGLPAAEAEPIIDRLEAAGALIYEGSDTRVDDPRACWRFDPTAIGRP